MKLKMKLDKPKSRLLADTKRPEAPKADKDQSKAGSWKFTSPDEQQEALERNKALTAKRAPELWIRDGEDRLVRFRQDGPIATIFAYRVRVNGRWQQITAPPEGEVDLFREELNLRPSFRAIYEVIDIAGYVDKKGTKIKNVPRFFCTSNRNFEALRKLSHKRGPLTGYDVEISRVGADTSTVYTFLPQSAARLPDSVRNQDRLAPQFDSFYAPPSESEQRALVRLIQHSSGHDED